MSYLVQVWPIGALNYSCNTSTTSLPVQCTLAVHSHSTLSFTCAINRLFDQQMNPLESGSKLKVEIFGHLISKSEAQFYRFRNEWNVFNVIISFNTFRRHPTMFSFRVTQRKVSLYLIIKF